MPVYRIGFSDFQSTLLLVVSVEVVLLGSLEGAIDNALSTVVVAFVAVVFCNTKMDFIAAIAANDKEVMHGFFQKVRKVNSVYFMCRALTYFKKLGVENAKYLYNESCQWNGCQHADTDIHSNMLIIIRIPTVIFK